MPLDDNPLWYKEAIIYQLHVRSFLDSNGDGIGDFRGLTQKLDYLQDLGITALWLLPFYPSPLKDDGYDTADYTDVHPSYGTLHDFKVFLREAHRRGLRIITELVVNHTSDQHPWFQKARHAPAGSAARDFYVWTDNPEKYKGTRIIFPDYETSNWQWDPVAKAYYWHRFFHHQPDLNYDNPHVRKAIFKVLDFWMKLGVDGMRLDAVPYLFEREGTNCENLPETHAFLKEMRRYIDRHYKGRMFIAEANQWPEDAVTYMGDECHMAFHFPLMPRMFMSLRMEDRFPIIDILQQTPEVHETNQWALFLRNHDELTLEMVTDEERDYMYRVYAHEFEARINMGIRRRLAPLMSNQRRKLELMNGLLLSMPGTPILYYGDEIGLGDNIYLGDRNGVRTPMQWSGDRNAGFSTANPQKLFLPIIIDPEYHYEAVNVEAQQKNPQSLLWWTKRLIALRKRYKAFGRGTIEFLHPDNTKVLTFVRRYENECLLVVANLSRFTQYAELDLSAFKGLTPIEVFGHTEFPVIGDNPYFLSLGAHNFYWFSLEAAGARLPAEPVEPPMLTVRGEWPTLLQRGGGEQLERHLVDYVQAQRWFGAKARRIKSMVLTEAINLGEAGQLCFVRVEYRDGDPDDYALPLAFLEGDAAAELAAERPGSVIVGLRLEERRGRQREGLLCDATHSRQFADALLQAIDKRRSFRGQHGEIQAWSAPAYRGLRGNEPLSANVLQAEQSNTSIVYGNRLILKLFRRLANGRNPELEIGQFLTEGRSAVNVPAIAGALEYRRDRDEAVTVGILEAFVPNEGNAWTLTQDNLGRYFERAIAHYRATGEAPETYHAVTGLLDEAEPALYHELSDVYVEYARLLGRRTAEFHLALAAGRAPAFSAEPFSTLYQRSVYQSMRNLTAQTFQQLRKRLRHFDSRAKPAAEEALRHETMLMERFRGLIGTKIDAVRIRIHGDYHLGQVLYTGKDFVIIDFEGEPARSLTERRIKRSPLRDVAGMLRSFHYAAHGFLMQEEAKGLMRPDEMPLYAGWADYWYAWTSAVFLKSYIETVGTNPILPSNPTDLALLIDIYTLEKAVYELAYELNNRPDWVRIPLEGILHFLSTDKRR